MTSNEVKLLGAWPSPFVMRARIALNIKSVDYDFIQETKMGVKSELLLKSNPVHKKIPVVIHGDKPICESLVIVQYIDEFWVTGPLILPSDPYDRAMERFWAAYIDEKWFPSMSLIARTQEEEAKKAAIEQVKQGLVLLEDAFTKCSKGNKFFGGERIGYLDIALGCFLGWLRVTEKWNNVKLLDEAQTPGLCNWAHSFCSDPAVKEVMPDTDKLFEFSKVLMAKRAPPST